MDSLKNALRACTQLRRRVVRDVAATRCPDRRVGYPLNEFERQHPPRDSEPGYVEESENVPPQSHAQYLKPMKLQMIERKSRCKFFFLEEHSQATFTWPI